jgi:hypothetical protein
MEGRYRVEREQTEKGLSQYYLHSSRFDGVSDSAIWATARKTIGLMNGVVKTIHGVEPVIMGLPIAIRKDGSRTPMKQVSSDAVMPLEISVDDEVVAEGQAISASALMDLAEGSAAFSEALLLFAKPDARAAEIIKREWAPWHEDADAFEVFKVAAANFFGNIPSRFTVEDGRDPLTDPEALKEKPPAPKTEYGARLFRGTTVEAGFTLSAMALWTLREDRQ